jgi:hypothetical protein
MMSKPVEMTSIMLMKQHPALMRSINSEIGTISDSGKPSDLKASSGSGHRRPRSHDR